MTLSEVSSLCPAPEGWGNWYPEMDLFDTCVVGYVVEAKDGAAQVRIKDISSSGNAWNVSTFIRYKSSSSWVVETDADLPSAYLRALSAVGLAPDPEVEAMRAEVAALRAQLAAPLRLGRGPTLEEVEAVAAKESDRLGWWMLNFGGDGIAWEVCSLHVEDGAVLLDSGMSVYGFHDITDAIPLNASRQPCGVGVKL